jgi:hypothetical protein
LTIIKASGLAKILESNILGIDSVKLCQCANCIMPPETCYRSLSRIDRGYSKLTFLFVQQG